MLSPDIFYSFFSLNSFLYLDIYYSLIYIVSLNLLYFMPYLSYYTKLILLNLIYHTLLNHDPAFEKIVQMIPKQPISPASCIKIIPSFHDTENDSFYFFKCIDLFSFFLYTMCKISTKYY